ncbi:hypothetical protein [Acetivibrio sp. MSJd-27]|uniref:hypothetical protein n=1 Tax=Acetivibrio sp. MSJd-27 TaxID=2841523 RepID=UPI001C10828E|nr:hypothetical protein [Acetivibrio sp. MSJd-27]MBU5449172.1 hypothetical protein [Acetivibrio sp. MSJd-27]
MSKTVADEIHRKSGGEICEICGRMISAPTIRDGYEILRSAQNDRLRKTIGKAGERSSPLRREGMEPLPYNETAGISAPTVREGNEILPFA